MPFAYTKDIDTVVGNMRMTGGTYTGGGTTGGDIYTGLHQVIHFVATAKGSSVVADAPTMNETLPCADPITIIVTNNTDGRWVAFGW